jgi:hypothetical protein
MVRLKKSAFSAVSLSMVAGVLMTACQPVKGPQPGLPEQPSAEVILSPTPQPSAAPMEMTTPEPKELIPADIWSASSPLCQPGDSASFFRIRCDGQSLTISQYEERPGVDISLRREFPVDAESISLEFEALSTPASEVVQDQNQFGVYWVDENGSHRALRVSGQQYSFETWSEAETMKVEEGTQPVFSTLLKPAGQTNHLRWVCSDGFCDLFANGSFAARAKIDLTTAAKAVGIFAYSRWDMRFGEVVLSNFHASETREEERPLQLFSLQDDLRSDKGLFSQTILSGAFDIYGDEGFRFSPLIPYEFYTVRGGPALADSSVEVTVKMDVDLQRRASQFAGVACRSSVQGIYTAVIRSDGIYFIYRDTPSRPMALLARKSSDLIHTGGLAENRLRLDCVGSQLDFYINGSLAESLDDTRMGLNFGRAGLFTKAGGNPNPDAFIFSDFSVREIRSTP